MSADAPHPDRAVEAGRGALFIGFAKAFFMVSGFLQRWLLTRIVGPADYGAFSVVNNAISTVNNTMVQGTVQAISKFTAEDETHAAAIKRAGLKMQAVLATAVGLFFYFGAPVIASFERAPHYVGWFRMVAWIPFLYGFYSVFVGSVNGLRKFRWQASFDVGFSILKTILLAGGALLGARLGGPVTGAFAGFIGAAAIILVVATGVVGLPGRAAGPFPAARLVAFMVGIVAYTALINLALNYDLLLLQRYAGASAGPDHAGALVGNYEAMRNLALLPYQALLVITFVIFPLVSRSTFADDRETTRLYVTHTLRFSLILVTGMGVALAARPHALMRILYPPAYGEGAVALPVLVASICGLAVLAVCGSVINASGRPRVAVALVSITVVVGAVVSSLVVPAMPPGPRMLLGMAASTALGTLVALASAFVYLHKRFAARPPAASVGRVLLGALLAMGAAHLVPGESRTVGLAAIVLAEAVFIASLVGLKEFDATDRAKIRKILGRSPEPAP